MSLYDHLKDIVAHTHGLGVIDLVKVTGTEDETIIDAMSSDRQVIIQAKTHNPVPEFIGQFGMPNLSKLNIILGIPEYQKDATIEVLTKEIEQQQVPAGFRFENKNGDFKNEYRLMSAALVNEQLKPIKFKGVKWNVSFVPTVANVQRLKFMAAANSEETTFVAKTENGSLKFMFGDHSSHAGNFVFAEDVDGTLTKGYHWPISIVQGILNLPGDKIFTFSDAGAAQITVDSGLTVYNFIIPALQK